MSNSLVTGAALAAIALMLFGCGGGHDGNAGDGRTPAATAPKVSVQDLSTGSYTVSVGDANAPTVGKYYAGDDGSRLLLLAKADDRLGTLYRRDPGASTWVAVPAASADVQLTLLRGDALPAQAVDLAQLAGNYVAALGDGSAVRFALAAGGSITAGDGGCKLSGQVGEGKLPSTLKLTLNASAACAGLPSSSNGALVIDSDYTPARFRLVADNGSQALDLWSYRE
ncbi:hypothetical protein [Variovorax sp. OV329]|uniref:hypothetical protein n=1 Tax=Variovorax sp. OV329 TaxID=1882825 RepID=UPI0008E2FD83|nr:hypothetical protein [Variovorax sp. OV329]SFN49013.1 hypothetical protein SAMN05444747_13015 [Variovorax sp. OV329]